MEMFGVFPHCLHIFMHVLTCIHCTCVTSKFISISFFQINKLSLLLHCLYSPIVPLNSLYEFYCRMLSEEWRRWNEKKAAAAQRIFQAYALPKKKKQFKILYTVFLTAASHETRVFLVNCCA